MKVDTYETRLARLLVALAREDRSYYRTVDQIIKDGRALMKAGDAARTAIEFGKSPKRAFSTAKRVAEPYCARVVEAGDLAGTVLGLKLSSGQYRTAGDNVFRVS